ncbi:MAG TPA: acylphosphatase [Candidatus Limnocylindrales bacterium]|nr:acylphosphatase [Candidatus Limnocylindrales bacterium]
MTAERDRAGDLDAAPERLEAVVRGRVQGVGFRYFVMQAAAGLPITGWVANEPDGSVRCVAEGSRQALDALLERLRDGPGGARVDRVTETWMPATGRFEGFRVRSSAHSGD